MYKKNIFLLLLFFSNQLCGKIQPLSVLFVVGYFPAPSQAFILNQMTNLLDRGHNVFIHSINRGELTNMHPDIERYKLLDRITYGNIPKIFPSCDIVFCQFGYIGEKILKIKNAKSLLRDKKIVTCFRGSDITFHLKKDRTRYKKLFKRGHLFLPVCEYFRSKLIMEGCDPNKIIVHYSAIDCSQFFFKKRKKPENNVINIVSVCRLVEKKGLDDAIMACAKLVKKYPKICYTIFGEGPERAYLQQLIKDFHMEKIVTLAGWVTQEDVVKALDNAHIFILASKTSADGNEEGIPNALKEAMAMGLPVIATTHAGNPELIENGISGFLAPEKNSLELAKKIQYLIEHPEKWENLCFNARKKIEEKFEVGKTVERLEQLFYQLLES